MSAVSASPTSNILTESQNKRRRTTEPSNKRQKSSSSSTVVSSKNADDRVGKLLKDVENSRVELSILASKGAEKKLREHCNKLRKKVEVSCEAVVQNIRKSSAAMIAKINDYERDCLARSAERTKIREDIADQLRQSARLLAEFKQQMDSPASSENSENQNEGEVDDELIMSKLRKLKAELDAWKTHLLDCEFNSTNLSFAPNRELVRESVTLGDIVSRAATAPFPLEVDKLREIAVPMTRKKSTFQYAFAMCNGRQIVAFYHELDQRWQDEYVATFVCLLDEKSGRATVKLTESCIRIKEICHVCDEHTDVLVWSNRLYLGVYNHKLELLRHEFVREGNIGLVAANSRFVFLALWTYGKYELAIRRLDTLEHVTRVENFSDRDWCGLFANNEHLFVVSRASTVVVIELAELTQGGKVDDINWVMRTYETPEFGGTGRMFLAGYSLVYHDDEDKTQYSLDGRDGKRRERKEEADGPQFRLITQSGERLLFIDCSDGHGEADDLYQSKIFIRM